jgi:hypothetical protein
VELILEAPTRMPVMFLKDGIFYITALLSDEAQQNGSLA